MADDDDESSMSGDGFVDKEPAENVNPLYLATSMSEHSTLNRATNQKTSHHRVQQPPQQTSSVEPAVRLHRSAVTATPTDDPPTRPAAASPIDIIAAKNAAPTVSPSGSLPAISCVLSVKSSSAAAPSDDDQHSSSSGEQPPTAVVKPLAPPPTAPCLPTRLVRVQSAGQPDTNIPRVNCPEKIVICLDISKEMEKRSFTLRQGDKKTPLELVRRALNIFLQTKSALGSRHEFALMFLDNTAHWMCDFTTSPSHILTVIDGMNSCVDVDRCDLSSVFHEVASHVQPPDMRLAVDDPPFVVRVILIYGRSVCLPMLTPTKTSQFLHASDYFCLDVFYIHDPPSADNQCEVIFDRLCALDVKGNSYILEASKNATRIFDSIAQLLAHPLQRPLQHAVSYVIPGTNGSIGNFTATAAISSISPSPAADARMSS